VDNKERAIEIVGQLVADQTDPECPWIEDNKIAIEFTRIALEEAERRGTDKAAKLVRRFLEK